MAHKERVIRLSCPPRLAFDLSQAALKRVGLKIDRIDEVSGTIIAKKGMSALSWGHTFVVQLSAGGPLAPDDSAVTISSENHGFQLIEWGTNNRLLDKFELELKVLLEQASSSGEIDRSKWRPRV